MGDQKQELTGYWSVRKTCDGKMLISIVHPKIRALLAAVVLIA